MSDGILKDKKLEQCLHYNYPCLSQNTFYTNLDVERSPKVIAEDRIKYTGFFY